MRASGKRSQHPVRPSSRVLRLRWCGREYRTPRGAWSAARREHGSEASRRKADSTTGRVNCDEEEVEIWVIEGEMKEVTAKHAGQRRDEIPLSAVTGEGRRVTGGWAKDQIQGSSTQREEVSIAEMKPGMRV